MDGEIRGKPNLHLPENLFRRRNASGKRLALLLLNGGDGGGSVSPSGLGCHICGKNVHFGELQLYGTPGGS